MDWKSGKRISNRPMNSGIRMAQYTVLTPNSGPMNRKPMISRMMLSDRVMTDTGRGMKLDRIMASAAPLPMETWLGSMKKYTATATISTPTVMVRNSLMENFLSMVTTSL